MTAVAKRRSEIDKIPIDCNPKLGEVKLVLTEEFNPSFQYVILLFQTRVRFPFLTSLKEYNPDRKTLPTVKFCDGTIESVGFSKLDQTETVPLRSTKSPESSSWAEETPRLAVLESQRVVPEPLTRRRVPEERN